MPLDFHSSDYYPSELVGAAEIWNSVNAYEGMAYADIEKALMKQLLASLAGCAAVTLPSIAMKSPNRRWHIVSAIQKSVRRSDVDHAVRLSVAIQNSTEHEAFWRRFCVMALEDIGFANPVLAATILTVAGKKAWRESNGGALITAYLADRMARSAKSRTLCHLMCYAAASDKFEGARTHWCDLDLSQPEQADHLARWLRQDDYDEFPQRDDEKLQPIIAASALASKALSGQLSYVLPGQDHLSPRERKSQYSTGNRHISEEALDTMEVPLPSLWRYIVYRARSAGVEGLENGIPALFPHIQPGDMSLVSRKLPVMEVLDKLPSVAFDKHTIEGKRAIARFGKNCAPVKDFLAEHFTEDLHVAALGSAVFYAEGGEPMTPVLDSPLFQTVQRSEHAAFARRYGVTPEVFTGLHEVVAEHLGELNDARRFILGK